MHVRLWQGMGMGMGGEGERGTVRGKAASVRARAGSGSGSYAPLGDDFEHEGLRRRPKERVLAYHVDLLMPCHDLRSTSACHCRKDHAIRWRVARASVRGQAAVLCTAQVR